MSYSHVENRLPGVVVRVTVRKSAGPGSTPRPGAGKRSGNGGQSKGYGIFPSCPGFRPEQDRKKKSEEKNSVIFASKSRCLRLFGDLGHEIT